MKIIPHIHLLHSMTEHHTNCYTSSISPFSPFSPFYSFLSTLLSTLSSPLPSLLSPPPPLTYCILSSVFLLSVSVYAVDPGSLILSPLGKSSSSHGDDDNAQYVRKYLTTLFLIISCQFEYNRIHIECETINCRTLFLN